VKIIRLISITIFIAIFTGCTQSLLIKKVDLENIESFMKEQNNKIETVSLQQEKMDRQIEKEMTQQEASNQTMKDFSQAILIQLQTITDKQDMQDKRLKKIEKTYRTISSKGQQNAENKQLETQDITYAANSSSSDKLVVGAVEKVFLTPPSEILSARIDTGAATSSLDASDIEEFERNGHDWVRFIIINPKTNKEFTIERRIVRNVKIIQAVTDDVERRPVVELVVTIGRTTQRAEFTLSDRKHMEYPVLIGRNILMDMMIVDVSRSHIVPPSVPAESKEQASTP
jgi:hypothetical protein